MGFLRIIAGEWGGRKIIAPTGTKTRPSMGKTREGLFSALQSRLHFYPLRVLDLFAGSGALGLEALSRGANHAVFVDSSAQAIKALGTNMAQLNVLPSQHQVIQAKVDSWLTSTPLQKPFPLAFDLVFMDAPYALNPGSTLALLCQHGWLARGAWISVETAIKTPFVLPATLRLVREKRYGKAKSNLLHCVA